MRLIFDEKIRNFTLATFFSLLSIALLSTTASARFNGSAFDGDDGNSKQQCGQNRGRGNGKLDVIGLTSDQRLICFDEDDPEDANNIASIVGFIIDTSLVGIDFRPATGELYGLGNAGGVYTLDLNTAQATLKSRLNVSLSGNSFGVDFNPTVDRLRIISDNGQNLRANVDTGATLVDTSLNYTAGVTASGITGAAYTNNDADPKTATTLFNIDTVLDQVNIQAPPNAGTLNTTGKLNVDAGLTVGFDIYSRLKNGTTADVRALASLINEGQTRLYLINLFTGHASVRGSFNSFNQVIDLAIPLNQ
jgi:hypothetical protein